MQPEPRALNAPLRPDPAALGDAAALSLGLAEEGAQAFCIGRGVGSGEVYGDAVDQAVRTVACAWRDLLAEELGGVYAPDEYFAAGGIVLLAAAEHPGAFRVVHANQGGAVAEQRQVVVRLGRRRALGRQRHLRGLNAAGGHEADGEDDQGQICKFTLHYFLLIRRCGF